MYIHNEFGYTRLSLPKLSASRSRTAARSRAVKASAANLKPVAKSPVSSVTSRLQPVAAML